jgi:hypothetical protein
VEELALAPGPMGNPSCTVIYIIDHRLIDVDEDDSSNCRPCNRGAENGGGQTSVPSGARPAAACATSHFPARVVIVNSSGIVSPFRISSQRHHEAETEIIVSSLYCSQSRHAAA